jgi:hypothetical protein
MDSEILPPREPVLALREFLDGFLAHCDRPSPHVRQGRGGATDSLTSRTKEEPPAQDSAFFVSQGRDIYQKHLP